MLPTAAASSSRGAETVNHDRLTLLSHTTTMNKKLVINTVPVAETHLSALLIDRHNLDDMDSQHAARIAALESQIASLHKVHLALTKDLRDAVDARTKALRKFLLAHPEVMGDGRHLDTLAGRIGLRKGSWSVAKTTDETWESIAEEMVDGPLGDYVRVKYSVDKARLILDRESVSTDAMLAEGLTFAQDEEFYADDPQ